MSIDIFNILQHAVHKRLITRNTQRRLILDVFGGDYRLAAMKLSVRGEYALRALIVLGLDYIEGDSVVRIQKNSNRQNIPKRFLEPILSTSNPLACWNASEASLAITGSRGGSDEFGAAFGVLLETTDVFVDHQIDHLFKSRLRLPTHLLLRLRVVADQQVHLCRAEILGDMLPKILMTCALFAASRAFIGFSTSPNSVSSPFRSLTWCPVWISL